MNIILTLVTGICISTLIFFNGTLESYVGNFPSLIFIHLTGFTISASMFLKKTEVTRKKKVNPLYLTAGIIGIAVVFLNNIIFKKGGVLLTLSGTLTGQVVMAIILEVIRLKKTKERIPIMKIISIIPVITGAVIIGNKSGLPIYWILLSWLPGALIMAQSFMNSQNILALGFKKTLIIHYGLPLSILLISTIFLPVSDSFSKALSGEVPIIYLVGGGAIAIFIVSVGSYLLLKIRPITYVLLIYTGQLAAALFIDNILNLPFSREKLIAMILIITGLGLGEVNITKNRD